MGWGHGIDGNGREVGYGVEAECDFPECKAKIDRGMDFRCGPLGCETDNTEPGCGGFFCHQHITYVDLAGTYEQLCPTCTEKWPEAEDEGDMICRDDGSLAVVHGGVEVLYQP